MTESDSYRSLHETYYGKLTLIIETLRNELNLEAVPLIIGELGDFLGKTGFGQHATEYRQVNEQLQRFANEQPNLSNTQELPGTIDYYRA